MIHLVRGPEPDALRDKRRGKMTEARARCAVGETINFTGYGDDGVKDQIFKAQHGKCAYCEKREEQPKWRDAEHYRPKSLYWWLAWTWENLLFACIECNREYKKDQFPLVDETTRLTPEAAPPGDESPLLIDPYAPEDDPRVDIVFRRQRPGQGALDAVRSDFPRDRDCPDLWARSSRVDRVLQQARSRYCTPGDRALRRRGQDRGCTRDCRCVVSAVPPTGRAGAAVSRVVA